LKQVAAEVDKSILIGGLKFAQEGIRQIIDLIAELKEKVGRPKAEITVVSFPQEQLDFMRNHEDRFRAALITPIKQERERAVSELKKALFQEMLEVSPIWTKPCLISCLVRLKRKLCEPI